MEGHLARTNDSQVKEVIQAILDILSAAKIKNTFVSKFLDAVECDGWHYLFGNFNIGGTISGRLSSSSPNLQNLVAHGYMGKLVKSCFQAPRGWLWACSDYAGLEDAVNTLLTRDPNKIKVFTDGFDGHSLRAATFFSADLPDIDINDAKSVNRIKKEFGEFRDKAKSPHFALQYLGTWATLVKNCGFTPEEAKRIEHNYHELYKVSNEWVQSKLAVAAETGYVTLAFGVRLRTPILHKTILGSRFTPKQAAAESRSAGNAVSGQSYGLLNSKSGCDFQDEVLKSEYRYDIRPIAHIHHWWM